MELRTGRLMRLAAGALASDDIAQVPAHLERAAALKLNAADTAGTVNCTVNMRSNHPLSVWGRAERAKKKRKAKDAAAARRRNRK